MWFLEMFIMVGFSSSSISLFFFLLEIVCIIFILVFYFEIISMVEFLRVVGFNVGGYIYIIMFYIVI